jgi:uncharacterized protein
MNDRLERLWRRLDTPGHDACAVARDGDGHVIDGMAVFRNSNEVARLRYRVDCDAEWVTRPLVDGWVGLAGWTCGLRGLKRVNGR